jgi:UDPglucose 6-dehydrogenase
MKIAIASLGYVGLSNAVLLAQHNQVAAIDIVAEKVAMLNRKQSPIEDAEIEDYLQNKPLNLHATDYDPQTNYFNTRSIESVIQDVMAINPQAVMVIKSTVPVGYTAKTRALFKCDNLIFSPKSCAKAVPCMTTCTPAALWWVSAVSAPRPLPSC